MCLQTRPFHWPREHFNSSWPNDVYSYSVSVTARRYHAAVADRARQVGRRAQRGRRLGRRRTLVTFHLSHLSSAQTWLIHWFDYEYLASTWFRFNLTLRSMLCLLSSLGLVLYYPGMYMYSGWKLLLFSICDMKLVYHSIHCCFVVGADCWSFIGGNIVLVILNRHDDDSFLCSIRTSWYVQLIVELPIFILINKKLYTLCIQYTLSM